jgi:hypothetical protein
MTKSTDERYLEPNIRQKLEKNHYLTAGSNG